MSDSRLVVIPQNPFAVLGRNQSERALEFLRKLAPDADEVEFTTSEGPKFFDSGCNFERVECPSCGQGIPISWWSDMMDRDCDGKWFRLAEFETPCCQAASTLNDLVYDWPQGFARWSLRLMNPNPGRLAEEHRQEVESIVGMPLRVIYQRL